MGASPFASTRTEQDQLRAVRAALHHSFDSAAGAELVEQVLEEAERSFAGARIRDYLPLLVERQARYRLAAGLPRPGGSAVAEQTDNAGARPATSRRPKRRWARRVHSRHRARDGAAS